MAAAGEAKRAVVLIADGCEEVEALTQVDFLRRAGIEVVAAGVGARDIVGGHDIRINTDMTVDDLVGDFDAVVVPGGDAGAHNIAGNELAMNLITKQFAAGKLLAAICASPGVVLGRTDILAGRRFTCYPGYESRVSSATFVEDRVVEDGNVITSRGPGTAAEFAIAIVRRLVGDDAADKLHSATLQK